MAQDPDPADHAGRPLSAELDAELVARLRMLVEAIIALGQDLDEASVLRRLLRSAMEVSSAGRGELVVLDEEGAVELTLVEPPGAQDLTGQGGTAPGRGALREQVVLEGRVGARLTLAEPTSAAGFDDDDARRVRALCLMATTAWSNARLHEASEQLVLATERERIARDLHDRVVQQVFAAGLQVRALGRQAEPPEVREGLADVVAALDETIREIRSTILGLERTDTSRLAEDVRALAQRYAASLGFAPVVQVWGELGDRVGPRIADHLMSCLREALSNVARHAGARTCRVDLEVTETELLLQVADDGRGPGPAASHGESHGRGGGTGRGKGLRNLRRRAEELGGEVTVTAGSPRGTVLVWRVSLRPDPRS